ncbi:SgcJ/EcaC family oxidoreductase [Granulicella sp. dw_53]|uniref:YybH family protein n=1 Tax=Granulicella sp. dw_53 TaxID=2719792 RepID=UPI001BD29DE9|nr:SgcJ/EcaC family oxidoreductase [Granulicella sp. dw_53]
MHYSKTIFSARAWTGSICIAATLLATSCNHATTPDTHASEQTLRALDSQWSKAAAAHDLDSTVAFYADDAILLPADEPLATGKAAIRAAWTSALPAFETISWETRTIEVANSGELAYITGAWKATTKGPDGTSVPSTGKIVEVWKKQADGQWKCIVDTYNADAPASPPPTPTK